MPTKELLSQIEYIRESQREAEKYSKGIVKLFELAMSYVYDAEQAYHEGRKAAWVLGLWEVPLLYACDTIPVSFTELGRLGNPDSITIAEDYFQVPKETCSMVSALLGEWYLRKDNGIKRLLAFNNGCEPLNLAYELLKPEGFDIHRVESVYLPPDCDNKRYEQRVEFLTEQLYEAAKWLNEGKALNENKMSFEIKRRNEIIKKLGYVMKLRLDNPLYLKSLATMYLLMGSGHYFGKPEEYVEVLDLLIEELEKGDYRPDQKYVPLVWAGGRGQEFGVYKAIDDLGGAVLGWMTPNPFAGGYREDIPPVESLSRYLLDGQLAGSTVHRREAFENQLKVSNAKGIIFYGYVGCSFAGIQQEIEREYFHNKGIPSIGLEGSFQVGPPTGQLLTRIRAFIEMLI